MSDTKELFQALKNLKDEKELEKFFADLCTPQEIETMAERWQVAGLLEKEVPYRQIYEKTGVSTATVTRVARALHYGTGYRLALNRKKRRGKLEC